MRRRRNPGYEYVEWFMPRPVIAVTDSPFPSLDPARAALARIDPELRMARSASAEDILAVARDADAVLVTYAKLSADLLGELSRCRAIGALASSLPWCSERMTTSAPAARAFATSAIVG